MTPFIDLHVLRDASSELTLYGDDGAEIEVPTAAQLRDALDRLDVALAHWRRLAELWPLYPDRNLKGGAA